MRTLTPVDSLPPSAVEDAPFYEIVHNDPLLLRVEFDNLIDGIWEPMTPTGRQAVGGSRGTSSDDLHYQYDRHEPVSIAIGTDQIVEMPAAGQEGVLQVTCMSCGADTIHHVGWLTHPLTTNGGRCVRLLQPRWGNQTPTPSGDSRPDDGRASWSDQRGDRRFLT